MQISGQTPLIQESFQSENHNIRQFIDPCNKLLYQLKPDHHKAYCLSRIYKISYDLNTFFIITNKPYATGADTGKNLTVADLV